MSDVTISDPRPPMVVLRERLQAREGELRAALTDITPEQFIRAVMTSVAINPDILACSWPSLWTACMRACRDGLLPDGVDGAIVAYGKNNPNAQWIPMYQGLLRRFRRSGQFKWITANVVREGEEFTHYIDENGEHFRHVPSGNTLAPVIKVYALATTKDGGVFVAVMSKAEVDKIKAMSRATRDDSPWKMWEAEMQKKTVLRRLCKYLPSARDLMPEDDDEPDMELPPAPQLRSVGQTSSLVAKSVTPTAASEANGDAQGQAGEAHPSAVDDDPAATDALVNEHLGDVREGLPGTGAMVLVDAYERGKTDKTRGVQARAVPPEYREPTRTREALAWQAGHSGQSMPQFGSDA